MHWAWLLLVVVAAALVFLRLRRHTGAPQARFVTARIETGTVAEVVEATGTVQPVMQVQVGSQISGRVVRVHADFNQRVHEGDLIAEIDPIQYETALAQSRASLVSAQASLSRARSDASLQERNLQRYTDLRTRGLGTPADLDVARHAVESAHDQLRIAEAEVNRASANVQAAQTNIRYTQIHSPIDGIVITRSVDAGQTVAATLAAPVLFVIANDLTRMRVIADVDEADIGNLQSGTAASVHVDAYPNRRFEGRVGEVRFGPTNTQGVVTYPAVIDVDNADMRLRPGMTALVTIVTARHENVLHVPNAALRYRPGGIRERVRGTGEAPADPGTGTVYVLRGGQPRATSVRVPLTNGVISEVEGAEIRAGTEVVLGDADLSGQDANASNSRGRTF